MECVPTVSNQRCLDCRDDVEIDLWFLIDGVTTYSDDEFEATKNFISNVASSFDISTARVQIGYGASYEHQYLSYFNFSNTNDLRTLQNALEATEKPSSTGTKLFLSFRLSDFCYQDAKIDKNYSRIV